MKPKWDLFLVSQGLANFTETKVNLERLKRQEKDEAKLPKLAPTV